MGIMMELLEAGYLWGESYGEDVSSFSRLDYYAYYYDDDYFLS